MKNLYTFIILIFLSGITYGQGQNCDNAVLISEGVFTCSDPSVGLASNLCFNDSDSAKWYRFESNDYYQVTVSSEGFPSMNTNTRLSIHDGDCTDLSCLEGMDSSGSGGTSEVDFYTFPNETYYIEWDDIWSNESFMFSLTAVPAIYCPIIDMFVGEICNDGNDQTYYDRVNEDCNCIGILYDCPDLMINYGYSCDDGDADTWNDTVDDECNCIGEPVDCPDDDNNIGTYCDDGDSATYQDVVQDDCTCSGILPQANYTCELAYEINEGIFTDVGPVFGDGASNDCFGSGATHASWYKYTATQNGLITITSGIDPDLPDNRLSVFGPNNDCSTLDCLSTDDDGGPAFTSLVSLEVEAGDWFYLEWDDRWWYNDQGFDFIITYEDLELCPEVNGYVGYPCDDGQALTYNDIVTVACQCVGEFEPVDTDGDGLLDADDNCPGVSNVDQLDYDLDLIGDACDEDIDGDGEANEDDCEPYDNTFYTGSVCDDADPSTFDDQIIGDCSCQGITANGDYDEDGILDVDDNCPFHFNPGQQDFDNDGLGNICDQERDGDGVLNFEDNCEDIPNPDQADLDLDGIGDACDNDIDGDGEINENDCDPMDALIYLGASCDDGDPETSGDTIQVDCSCEGVVGLSEIKDQINDLEVYPNPSEGLFYIKDYRNRSQLRYEIHNIIGDLIVTGISGADQAIDIKNVSSGLYYLKVLEKGKLIGTYKLLKD